MSGKHYNRSIRILQYVYDALTRFRIDKFNEFLKENFREDALTNLINTEEFQTCLKEVSNVWKILSVSAMFAKLVIVF